MRRQDCGSDCVGPDCEGCQNFKPLSSHAVLGEVSAGQFIQKHFIALKSLLNNSELFAYDDIIEFENVCLKLGISCEVVDGYLR